VAPYSQCINLREARMRGVLFASITFGLRGLLTGKRPTRGRAKDRPPIFALQ
jgi:hypothetical protein